MRRTTRSRARFPLAGIEPGRPLPLNQAANPAWAAALGKLRSDAVKPILGDQPSLTEADWVALLSQLGPFQCWSAGKAGAAVEKLGLKRVREILPGKAKEHLTALIAEANRDPFFHNVFSLFEGKRFDTRALRSRQHPRSDFSKPGISYIFCNIHAEMSAVVIALDTPYYGISNQHGDVVIPNVPLGHYTLRVWHEDALPETLNSMARPITVSESTSTLGILRIAAAGLPHNHKNKYGRDYDPPAPDDPAYQHP